MNKRTPKHIDSIIARRTKTRGISRVGAKKELSRKGEGGFRAFAYFRRAFRIIFVAHTNIAVAVLLVFSVIPLSAFEAHVVNVTAKIEPRTCAPVGFEHDAAGDPILPGQRIETEYSSWGLTIFAESNAARGVNRAIAFDSENPTGDDFDLGTPNEDFFGPGIGAGGGAGEPGENINSQGNLLIIAENMVDGDGDRLIDDPDDEASGGRIDFRFIGPTRIDSIRFFDIEEDGVFVRLIDHVGAIIQDIPIPALGDNSAQKVAIGYDGVEKMEVHLTGSGAVDDLCFDIPEEPPPLCDARPPRYWGKNEGCTADDGSSVWSPQINALSSQFSNVFTGYTGADVCDQFHVPCPGANTYAAQLCRAKRQTLTDEINVASGHLDLPALIAGADDGHPAFDNLGLSSYSTVEETLAALEAIIANGSSTPSQLFDAAHVAERVHTFYGQENPFAPECIYDPNDVPACLNRGGNDFLIHNDNDAVVENDISSEASAGGNSAEGGGSGGNIETGDASSSVEVVNEANDNDVIPTDGSGEENNTETPAVESQGDVSEPFAEGVPSEDEGIAEEETPVSEGTAEEPVTGLEESDSDATPEPDSTSQSEVSTDPTEGVAPEAPAA